MSIAFAAFWLLLLLGSGLAVGLALLGTGIVLLEVTRDAPLLDILGFATWQAITSPELAALVLFVLMGEILFNTRLSEALFRGLAPWLRPLPGGLLHVNILGCTLFAAVSGSSAATTATIGRLTLGELSARGYDEKLSIGSLCGAGTLGFLIPPSIVLILYGVIAEVSIIDLFLAGIVPGLIVAFLYMAYVGWRAGGRREASAIPLRQKLAGLGLVIPVILLILLVLGTMYLGIATPGEAATIGVLGALIVAFFDGSLSRHNLGNALNASLGTISMISLILIGALFLTRVAAYLGLPQWVEAAAVDLALPPLLLMLILLAFYVALGTILDGLSIIIMTLPVTLPLVEAAGYSPVWFAIFLVIAVEMAQITPPVGFNLFVVQKLTGKPIGQIARASLPFFLILGLFALVLVLVPGLAVPLPDLFG